MRFTKLSSVVFLDKDIYSNDINSIELIFSHNDANNLADRLQNPGESYTTVVLIRTIDHEVAEVTLEIKRTYVDYIFTLINRYVEPVKIICFTTTPDVFERFVKNIS